MVCVEGIPYSSGLEVGFMMRFHNKYIKQDVFAQTRACVNFNQLMGNRYLVRPGVLQYEAQPDGKRCTPEYR